MLERPEQPCHLSPTLPGHIPGGLLAPWDKANPREPEGMGVAGPNKGGCVQAARARRGGPRTWATATSPTPSWVSGVDMGLDLRPRAALKSCSSEGWESPGVRGLPETVMDSASTRRSPSPPPAWPPNQTPPRLRHVHCLYFSSFTKVNWATCGAGVRASCPQGQRRGRARGQEAPGERSRPLEEGVAGSPSSACCACKAPDHRPVLPRSLRPRGWWGQGSSVWDLKRLPPLLPLPHGSRAPVQDLWSAPQRMTGAERSLVTVGRSFTVAKGFVPLCGGRG